MNLKHLFQKPPKVPTQSELPKASPVLREINKKKWIENPQNTAQLRALFESHFILKDWLGVAWSEMPRGYPSRGQTRPITGEEAAHELGRVNGYMACLDLLQSLLEYQQRQQSQPQMTYPKTIEETYSLNK